MNSANIAYIVLSTFYRGKIGQVSWRRSTTLHVEGQDESWIIIKWGRFPLNRDYNLVIRERITFKLGVTGLLGYFKERQTYSFVLD